MKRTLVELSIEELVHLFVDLAIANDDALLGFETKKSNRLYDRIGAIVAELTSREGDQRRALIPLYTHPNPQVRLKAATVTLAIAPVAARAVLESMSDIRGPQRLNAGMAIRGLDDGSYKPT